ncbi:hypothetical protein GXM_05678 [Nostoc sphaeroides CCNUC1]|uniref:Uncharacterized protein n=1 Tax=Nostoc sphaeroides CCNUC1 TaxID=2653204 RepID=A0A5P8W7G9_9NOSO|nr:hypothetical protein GXM_05678 [Nostoc sphaeroides CCNUC1]
MREKSIQNSKFKIQKLLPSTSSFPMPNAQCPMPNARFPTSTRLGS